MRCPDVADYGGCALDKLGEGERAAGIATGWLQRRLVVDGVTNDGSSVTSS